MAAWTKDDKNRPSVHFRKPNVAAELDPTRKPSLVRSISERSVGERRYHVPDRSIINSLNDAFDNNNQEKHTNLMTSIKREYRSQYFEPRKYVPMSMTAEEYDENK